MIEFRVTIEYTTARGISVWSGILPAATCADAIRKAEAKARRQAWRVIRIIIV
jgi:hypothetical protein